MIFSCSCGRQWTGLAQCHCGKCHCHFTTESSFDRHRMDLKCLPVERFSELMKTGKPRLSPITGPYGITWATEPPKTADE